MMSPAESPEAQPAAVRSRGSGEQSADATRLAVARVLGIDPSTLREDTPLAALGWDSLARICWADAVAEEGARVDAASAARATDLAGLAQCVIADGGTR